LTTFVVVEPVEAVRKRGRGPVFHNSTGGGGSRKETLMGKTRPPYPAEFREQIVELVRAGAKPADLAKEFGPSPVSIRAWVRQADRDEGKRDDGLTTDEREELRKLRRENRQLKLDREILVKAAAWFARETGSKNSSS
jgi:transposase